MISSHQQMRAEANTSQGHLAARAAYASPADGGYAAMGIIDARRLPMPVVTIKPPLVTPAIRPDIF